MPEEEFRQRWDARPLDKRTFADLDEVIREWEAEESTRADAQGSSCQGLTK